MKEKILQVLKYALVVGGAGAATYYGGPAAGSAAMEVLKSIFGG